MRPRPRPLASGPTAVFANERFGATALASNATACTGAAAARPTRAVLFWKFQRAHDQDLLGFSHASVRAGFTLFGLWDGRPGPVDPPQGLAALGNRRKPS